MTPEKFREIRCTLGLTQTAYADKLGITRAGVAKLEAGECNVSKTVALLAVRLYKES